MGMLVDYHTHTKLCKHATGEIEEYIDAAIKAGLGEIGISDHNPMPDGFDAEYRMVESELPKYIDMVNAARQKFPKATINIRLGLEADFHPLYVDYVRDTIAKYDFDYVIGSVHYIDDWGFDNPKNISKFGEADIYKIYRDYFALVVQAAMSGLYDIIGHPDVVKKFGYRVDKDYDAIVTPALEAIKKAEVALDLNTSGLRFPCKEIYPAKRFLELACEMGIPITLGSDSHKPGDIARDFDRAIALAKSVGYKTILRFKARKSEEVKI